MKDTFIVGVILGMLAGAVLVTYNSQIANVVEKGKNVVKKQIEKI